MEFKREYLVEWAQPSKGYKEAYKLWLWYFYHCELYDSRICTGKNQYDDYVPMTNMEYKLINQNAIEKLHSIQYKRKSLECEGIYITENDWLLAKRNFSRYKLKALENEYKHYFENE